MPIYVISTYMPFNLSLQVNIQLLPSTVKRETSGTASAWECVGSSRGSNKGAADTITGERDMTDTNCSRQQQQRGSSSSSTLSTGVVGPWLPVTSPNSASDDSGHRG